MSNKSAKVSSNEKNKPDLIGNPILYIGNSDRHFTCPVCGRNIVKGFLYEEKSQKACSRKCLETLVRV